MTGRILRFVVRYCGAALGCLFLFSVGWLWPRNRALLTAIGRHFGLAERREPPMLPLVDPAQLLELNGPLTLLEPVGKDGNVSLLELVIMSRSVAQAAPLLLFEIGTFDGRTTLNLAANAPTDAKVLTIDLPANEAGLTKFEVADGDARYIEKNAPGQRFADKPNATQIQQLLGDSAQFDFSPYFGSIDWVFIDGAHSYEYVLNDSAIAKRLLGPRGGWIFWHDYGEWDGVTRALNELVRRDEFFSHLRQIHGTSLAVLFVGSQSN